MASRARLAQAKREIQGWMALAMFGCHCGERAPGQRYEGNWICTHVARAHPELIILARMNMRGEKHTFIIRDQ